MAEGKKNPAGDGGDKVAKLEARIAELEDKISRLTVSEKEWETFKKVTSALSGQGGMPAGATGAMGLPLVMVGFGVYMNCARCFACSISACMFPMGGPGSGKKPDVDFDEFGKE